MIEVRGKSKRSENMGLGYSTTALLGDTNKFFIPWLIPRNDRNSIFSPNIFGKLASRTKRNNDEQGKFSYTKYTPWLRSIYYTQKYSRLK